MSLWFAGAFDDAPYRPSSSKRMTEKHPNAQTGGEHFWFGGAGGGGGRGENKGDGGGRRRANSAGPTIGRSSATNNNNVVAPPPTAYDINAIATPTRPNNNNNNNNDDSNNNYNNNNNSGHFTPRFGKRPAPTDTPAVRQNVGFGGAIENNNTNTNNRSSTPTANNNNNSNSNTTINGYRQQHGTATSAIASSRFQTPYRTKEVERGYTVNPITLQPMTAGPSAVSDEIVDRFQKDATNRRFYAGSTDTINNVKGVRTAETIAHLYEKTHGANDFNMASPPPTHQSQSQTSNFNDTNNNSSNDFAANRSPQQRQQRHVSRAAIESTRHAANIVSEKQFETLTASAVYGVSNANNAPFRRAASAGATVGGGGRRHFHQIFTGPINDSDSNSNNRAASTNQQQQQQGLSLGESRAKRIHACYSDPLNNGGSDAASAAVSAWASSSSVYGAAPSPSRRERMEAIEKLRIQQEQMLRRTLPSPPSHQQFTSPMKTNGDAASNNYYYYDDNNADGNNNHMDNGGGSGDAAFFFSNARSPSSAPRLFAALSRARTVLYPDHDKQEEVFLHGCRRAPIDIPSNHEKTPLPSYATRYYPHKQHADNNGHGGVPYDTDQNYRNRSVIHHNNNNDGNSSANVSSSSYSYCDGEQQSQYYYDDLNAIKTQKKMVPPPEGRRNINDEDNFLIKTSRMPPPEKTQRSEKEGFAVLLSTDPSRLRQPLDGMRMLEKRGKIASDFVKRTHSERLGREQQQMLERREKCMRAFEAERLRMATRKTHDESFMASKGRKYTPATDYSGGNERGPYATDLPAPHMHTVGKSSPWFKR